MSLDGVALEQVIKQAEKVVKRSSDQSQAEIIFPNLHLTAENPTSEEISIVLKKTPLRVEEGKSYGGNAVLIDTETKLMQELTTKAEEIKKLPEIQRPRALLALLGQYVKYAYNQTVEELANSNPSLAKWVAENTGLNSSVYGVPLSQLFEKGYGICRHLSVAYLWLAQKAGIEGVLMRANHGVLKNIQRPDTGGKLFQTVELNQPGPNHAWVELRASDGKWIPVDPSTRLVGDTDEGLSMFRQANYMADATAGLNVTIEPKELSGAISSGAIFGPGEENSTEGKHALLLRSTQPISSITRGKIPGTNEPYSGKGVFGVESAPENGYMNVSIASMH